jgi:Tfp pilus assembly protein PilO
MSLGRVTVARVVAILIVVAIAAVAWFVVLSPRLDRAASVRASATQLQDANLNLSSQYNRSLTQAKEAPAAAAEAQALFAKMPQTADLPAVLDQITAAATTAGINPNDVSSLTTGIPVPVTATGTDPTAEKTTGVQLARLDVGVTAEGSREQSLTFLDNLQALDRVLLVTSNQVTSVSQVDGVAAADRETLQVGGSMFVLQSKLPDLVATVNELISQAEATTGVDASDETASEG